MFKSLWLLRIQMLPINVRVKLSSLWAEGRKKSGFYFPKGRALFRRELQNPIRVPWWMLLMVMMPISLGNRLHWSEGCINCFKTGILARPWQGQAAADEIHLDPESVHPHKHETWTCTQLEKTHSVPSSYLICPIAYSQGSQSIWTSSISSIWEHVKKCVFSAAPQTFWMRKIVCVFTSPPADSHA